jgi:CheY-like chemotaxis protein
MKTRTTEAKLPLFTPAAQLSNKMDQPGTFRYSPKMYMLLVDDDPVFCRVMEELGKKMNVAVTSCGSIPEITAVAVPGVFDIAVIDYNLDGARRDFKGTSVANYLKRTPSILISQSESCHQQGESWPFNIKRFIHKALGPEAIVQAALQLIALIH